MINVGIKNNVNAKDIKKVEEGFVWNTLFMKK